ncbi:MAG TPA: polysaccharide biosynthesis tyrosine autokinase [Cryptosporangiaceae bacterium]|nr:polysaccharide biosynthesis tyrosine autokinase [Cryptosporangiaceae bacterium]
MDLRDYLRAVRKRWWLVLAATGLAATAASLMTATTPPQYASTVTFFVTTPNRGVSDAYQGGLFSQQRVKSYADLLTSERLSRAVVEDGRVDLSSEDVRTRITAEAVPDTVLLRATVTDPSQARSLQIAKAVATEFVALVRTLETPPGSRTPAVKVEVVSAPRSDPTPVSPRPVRDIGLATGLGVLAGLGLAVLRERLDTTVKTTETLERTAAAVLASIPFDSSAKKAPLIVEGSARSPRAEAFRQLRTNLQFVDVDRRLKAVVVTSALANEGKSTTATNLAIVLAESGARVVLVEADLRRPLVADYLGVERAVGLTNVLAGQVEVGEVLQEWGTSGLWVLPSGSIPPNPSELLGSRNMADLVEALKAGFDVVVIDTPPLLPVTDAAVVAARADGALMVVRHGRTTRSQVTTATAALRAVDAQLHGCVLNMVPGRYSDAYHYDYVHPQSGDRSRWPWRAWSTRHDETPQESEPSGAHAPVTARP